MRSRFGLVLSLILSAWWPGEATPAMAGEQALSARFDVNALGFKVGELTIDGRLGKADYDVTARFGTTGLVRLFRDMGFVMRAHGIRSGGRLWPDEYVEQVNTGSRISNARLVYDAGVPRLVGGRVEDGEVEPLDPATQGGTIDPLTALFTVLRDRPDRELCTTDVDIFDGGRRTRVLLTGRIERHGKVTCVGQFRRVDGYPARDMKRRRVVPLSISYEKGENGLMRATGASLRTTYGPVGLTRRE